MVYITGDIHGAPRRVVNFAKDVHISRNDTLIILGDVGANYYLTELDNECKRQLNSLKCTVFCIHGNHECRPEHIPSYEPVTLDEILAYDDIIQKAEADLRKMTV